MNSTATFVPGLEGVVAARTRLSSVDGEAGELIVRGFLIEELAAHGSFEETVFLLWNDRLPTADELSALRRDLTAHSTLPAATIALLEAAVRARIPTMDALRMAIDSLALASDTSGARRRRCTATASGWSHRHRSS